MITVSLTIPLKTVEFIEDYTLCLFQRYSFYLTGMWKADCKEVAKCTYSALEEILREPQIPAASKKAKGLGICQSLPVPESNWCQGMPSASMDYW